MALAAVELGLRCSSLSDSEDLYSTALPREPHSSRAVTDARAAARSARPQHLNRLLHVSMWSQQMANAVLRASNHLRTRLLDISQTEAPRVDWLGKCVPNAPSSTWPGAFQPTFVRALHAPKRARSTRGRRKCLQDCSEARPQTGAHTAQLIEHAQTRAAAVPYSCAAENLRMQVRACTGFQRNTRRSWVDFGRSLNRLGSLQPPLPWFSHRRRQTTTTLHRHRCSYVLDPSVRPVAWAQRRGGVMVHVQSPGHRSRHRRGGAGTGRAWALLLTVEPAFRRRGRP